MKKTVVNISGHLRGSNNTPIKAHIRGKSEDFPESNIKNRILVKQHLIDRNKRFLNENKDIAEVIRKKIEQDTKVLEDKKNTLLSMLYREALKDL